MIRPGGILCNSAEEVDNSYEETDGYDLRRPYRRGQPVYKKQRKTELRRRTESQPSR